MLGAPFVLQGGTPAALGFMTDTEPTKKTKTLAVALERDAYDIAAARAAAAGITRKAWVSNAIRIAAALAGNCVSCEAKPRKETRRA